MKTQKQGRVRIVADPHPSNPREDFAETATVIALYSRRRGMWGDKGANPNVRPPNALPVYAYEHGGIALALKPFSCPFDSGQAGYIWLKDGESQHMLEAELREFEQYINGEVYGYVVETRTVMENPTPGGPLLATPWEHEDSCFGFYGSDHKKSGLVDCLPKWAVDNELWIDRSDETGHSDGIFLPDD